MQMQPCSAKMRPMKKSERFVSPRDAAYFLGLSRRTLSRREREGKLVPHKFNSRVVRYKEADVLALQPDRSITAVPAAPRRLRITVTLPPAPPTPTPTKSRHRLAA